MNKPKQPGSGTESGYNGWTNYETWNVSLWIGNDEGLYEEARRCKHARETYKAFAEAMRELGSLETPDGVAWNDSGLDIEALNKMLGDL